MHEYYIFDYSSMKLYYKFDDFIKLALAYQEKESCLTYSFNDLLYNESNIVSFDFDIFYLFAKIFIVILVIFVFLLVIII